MWARLYRSLTERRLALVVGLDSPILQEAREMCIEMDRPLSTGKRVKDAMHRGTSLQFMSSHAEADSMNVDELSRLYR